MTRLFFRNIRTRRTCLAPFLMAVVLGSRAVCGVSEGEPPPMEPGQDALWRHSSYGENTPLILFLPESYHDPAHSKRTWSVILWFHGTHGRPTTRLMREAGAGTDFVIVGMTYRQSGQFQYSPESLVVEMKAYREVIRDLQESAAIRIDPRRVYVGGFSKGGWLSALFFEKDPQLAGAMVMGGGVFDRPDTAGERFPASRPVYVGIGSIDPNLAMSRKAEHFFGELGARVTMDVWPGLGHEYPTAGEEHMLGLRQWLAIEAASAASSDGVTDLELRDEAIEWFGDEVRKLKRARKAGTPGDPVETWLALEDLSQKPYFRIIDGAARDQAKELREELLKDPRVAEEKQVRLRYRKIQREEFVDLTIERLAGCASSYRKLWMQYPQTHHGELARQSYERTQRLLRGVKSPPR